MNKIISPEAKEILIKRSRAFIWHAGSMVGIALVDFIATNLNLFNLPEWSVVLLGLVLAQITKALNTSSS